MCVSLYYPPNHKGLLPDKGYVRSLSLPSRLGSDRGGCLKAPSPNALGLSRSEGGRQLRGNAFKSYQIHINACNMYRTRKIMRILCLRKNMFKLY